MEISVDADGDGLALSRPTRPLSPAIRAAQRCIETSYAETLSLVQLAALSGLSMHRFATAFREQVGMPPHNHEQVIPGCPAHTGQTDRGTAE